MAHYVLSDMHGHDELFHRMLETLEFTENDTLYILGDAVDRGPHPIRLLTEIMHTENMVMLLGNHEHMCMRYNSPDVTPKEIRRWDLNNNIPTKRALAELSADRREQLFDWIRALPTHLEVTVNSRRFYLAHGFPNDDPFEEVWGRPKPDTPNPRPGCTVIVGHTPVCGMGRDDAQENAYLQQLEENGEHMRIYHADGFLDIDCGCGYDLPSSALACIRLEDMREFYVR